MEKIDWLTHQCRAQTDDSWNFGVPTEHINIIARRNHDVTTRKKGFLKNLSYDLRAKLRRASKGVDEVERVERPQASRGPLVRE